MNLKARIKHLEAQKVSKSGENNCRCNAPHFVAGQGTVCQNCSSEIDFKSHYGMETEVIIPKAENLENEH